MADAAAVAAAADVVQDLGQVAGVVSAELVTFEAAVAAAALLPLATRAQLVEAGRALSAVGDSDRRLGAALAALAAALGGARARRTRQADAVSVRAQELAQRTAEWDGLSDRYHELAAAAANTLAGLRPGPPAKAQASATTAKFVAVGEPGRPLPELVEAGSALADAARVQGFTDVAAQATALAEQLAQTHAKLTALGQA